MKNFLVKFSEGRNNLGKVENKTLSWDDFKKLFKIPAISNEQFSEYQKMSPSERAPLKESNGFFCAAPCKNGSRKKVDILPRTILTLDVDENAKRLFVSLRNDLNPLNDFNFFLHTSRSHSPDSPKFRIIIALSREIDKDEHGPLSRIVSSLINPGMTAIDPVSHRPAQMMFKPSTSKDGEFVFFDNATSNPDAGILDPDEVFSTFKKEIGDWKDYSLLPYNEEKENTLRNTSKKAEDPLLKPGPVGVWCRAWDGEGGMEALLSERLSDHYLPADHEGTDIRFTPVGSTGAAGVIVYDDGRFLFSHHTTDPCAGLNVNCFDAVRLCLYVNLDSKCSADMAITQRPSWKSMISFIQDDPVYKKQLRRETYDLTAMAFDDIADEDGIEVVDPDEEKHRTKLYDVISISIGDDTSSDTSLDRGDKFDDTWFDDLESTKKGKLMPTLSNLLGIVTNDKRTKGVLAFNELKSQIVARKSIRSKTKGVPPIIVKNKEDGELWEDLNDATLRTIVSAPNGKGRVGYGINPSERDIRDTVMIIAASNKFHPIRTYFNSLEWDGCPRLDTCLHRYMGVEDNEYHAEVFRYVMLAAVARTFEPGIKFENMMILEGKQGVRKSTFVEVLGRRKWFAELTGDISDSKKMAEQIAGYLFLELVEMTPQRKADVDVLKAFLSRREEIVRLAYARRTSVHKRQCIFAGTTNKYQYMKDYSGHRRFWPVRVRVELIDIDSFEAELDQLYAEATYRYKEWRKQQPEGDLWLDLKSPEAKAYHDDKCATATVETAEMAVAGQIEAYIETPRPLSSILGVEDCLDDPDSDRMVKQTTFCIAQIWVNVLGNALGKLSQRDTLFIASAISLCPSLERQPTRKIFPRGYGKQTAYSIKGSAEEDRRKLWTEIPPPNNKWEDLI